MADVRCYLRLRPHWRSDVFGDDRLTRVTVESVTKTRPRRADGPVIALRLRIPDAAFLPLRPDVTIDVPDEALDFEPVVTVELPGDAGQ